MGMKKVHILYYFICNIAVPVSAAFALLSGYYVTPLLLLVILAPIFEYFYPLTGEYANKISPCLNKEIKCLQYGCSRKKDWTECLYCILCCMDHCTKFRLVRLEPMREYEKIHKTKDDV